MELLVGDRPHQGLVGRLASVYPKTRWADPPDQRGEFLIGTQVKNTIAGHDEGLYCLDSFRLQLQRTSPATTCAFSPDIGCPQAVGLHQRYK
jgi:hypothetical protein